MKREKNKGAAEVRLSASYCLLRQHSNSYGKSEVI